jgi:small-conductance mechanosensitive channel
MFERRIVFAIGVTYQTPRAQLEAIPGLIREAVEAQEHTRFDRSHFKEYGDFSLNFETVYYVTVPEYNLYMDIQQAINLRIHQRFEERAIEFAYPTQTLYMATQMVAQPA